MLSGLAELFKRAETESHEVQVAESIVKTLQDELRIAGEALNQAADVLRFTGHGGPAQLVKRASTRALEAAGER